MSLDQTQDVAGPPQPGEGPGLPRIGELVAGRFQIRSELGRGAAGAVYRAWDAAVDREVAVKLLLGSMNPAQRSRFLREGEIAASLDHPGIVRVHDAGWVEQGPYLVYEMVEGARPLGQVLPGLSVVQRAGLVRDLADALGHAHARGVVHRDVKPDNVLVDRDGHVRLTDFGVALGQGLQRMTMTGALVGTPHTMAPEQIAGDRSKMGPATDVWALGVVLYLCLCDEYPFQGESLPDLGAKILQSNPTPPSQVLGVALRALERVCLRALAKDPADRYADGAAMARALDEAMTGTLRASWRLPLVAAALVLLLSLAAGWFLTRSSAQPPSPATRPAQKTTRVTTPAPRPDRPRPRGLAPGKRPGEFINERDGSVLIWIPQPEGENPPLRHGYYIGKYEVRWDQFLRFQKAKGRPPPPVHFRMQPNHPAIGMTWKDAMDYGAWAKVRLPTAAEWRYAAQGDERRTYPWGRVRHTLEKPFANVDGPDDGFPTLAPVDAFPQGVSPFGCFNMSGNVREWVADTDGPKIRRAHGGSWRDTIEFCDSLDRSRLNPGYRSFSTGFRVARSAD